MFAFLEEETITLHPSSRSDSATDNPRPLEDAHTIAVLFLIPKSIQSY